MLCIFTLQGLDVSSICGKQISVACTFSILIAHLKKSVGVFCDKETKHLEYQTYGAHKFSFDEQ